MLSIKRIEFYDNGSVQAIEFSDLGKDEEVVAFCAKYKIGWQHFKPEMFEPQPLSEGAKPYTQTIKEGHSKKYIDEHPILFGD